MRFTKKKVNYKFYCLKKNNVKKKKIYQIAKKGKK